VRRPTPVPSLVYGSGVARIRSVGGIATLQGELANQLELDAAELEFVGIYVRLFAKTDGGLLAIDPQPQTYLSAISHVALRGAKAQAFADLVRVPEFLHPEIEGRTQAPWSGVIEDLRRTFGIETDAETLQSLDFEVLMDAELQQALARLSE
jgi:hypothetical protein